MGADRIWFVMKHVSGDKNNADLFAKKLQEHMIEIYVQM